MTDITVPQPKLTLGPVLFNWKPEHMRDFYFRIADEADVDTVCVGEVVCSKRSPFFAPMLPEVIARLAAAGKEVVLSSLALIMNERELKEARELAGTEDWLVEANDISVAAMIGGKPFAVGPLVNVYNEGTLAYLESIGATRTCLPAELPAEVIATLVKSAKCEIEVQAFGRLPLAISARCYHARSRNLAKDGCQYVCAEDPDGMAVDTLDDEAFLAVNGTQTMSYHYLSLLNELDSLRRAGVRRFRLWPQAVDMVAVAALFRRVLAGTTAPADAAEQLAELCPRAEFANGYIHGREGHLYLETDA
ncbi:MAG: ubiquinone anaerobic biosynthesis protein UbiV [Bacteroidales bacterium]